MNVRLMTYLIFRMVDCYNDEGLYEGVYFRYFFCSLICGEYFYVSLLCRVKTEQYESLISM